MATRLISAIWRQVYNIKSISPSLFPVGNAATFSLTGHIFHSNILSLLLVTQDPVLFALLWLVTQRIVVPTFRDNLPVPIGCPESVGSTTRCVTTGKSVYLTYIAAEAWNHAQISCYNSRLTTWRSHVMHSASSSCSPWHACASRGKVGSERFWSSPVVD